MKTLVLYHAHCADGFCAAWVVHKIMGDGADYIPVQYGQEPPDVKDKDVIIVDFSYKRPLIEKMMNDCKSLLILDHHKTAEKELSDVRINEELSKNIKIKFDMEKSGARITWDHYFPGQPVPWIVLYIEDRDLWRWSFPDSKEISAVIGSRPFDFRWFDYYEGLGLSSEPFNTLRAEGAAILRYQDNIINSAVKNAYEIELAGHKILTVNTTVLFSEIAGKLAKDRPFGSAFFIRSDGKKQWSLRSSDKGVDVSEIAKQFGGGGHRNAAGFEEMI